MANHTQHLIIKVRFRTAEQGGRATSVLPGTRYRPLLDLGLRGKDDWPLPLLCEIMLPEHESIRPGDDRFLLIEVAAAAVRSALTSGTDITLLEGSQVVAEGRIWAAQPQTMTDYIADLRADAGAHLYLTVVRVSNDRSVAANLYLEPSGMVVPMPPGVVYDIVAFVLRDEWRPEYTLRIDVAANSTLVWAGELWAMSLALFYRGNLVYNF